MFKNVIRDKYIFKYKLKNLSRDAILQFTPY